MHRLVATAFLDNPNSFPVINHKDEDKSNNAVSNLEWCSYAYNAVYGHARINWRNSMKRNHPNWKL